MADEQALIDQLGHGLETALLEWDGTIADPKLMDAYDALKAYRAYTAQHGAGLERGGG